MSKPESELPPGIRRGLAACRRGYWNEGLSYFSPVVADKERKLPAWVYSYVGYAVAQVEGREKEGLELCRYAARVDFYHAETFLNLARTCVLTGHRRAALRAVRKGLAIDPNHGELKRLWREGLGVRRRPVLPFLARSNPINKLLGRIRYLLTTPR